MPARKAVSGALARAEEGNGDSLTVEVGLVQEHLADGMVKGRQVQDAKIQDTSLENLVLVQWISTPVRRPRGRRLHQLYDRLAAPLWLRRLILALSVDLLARSFPSSAGGRDGLLQLHTKTGDVPHGIITDSPTPVTKTDHAAILPLKDHLSHTLCGLHAPFDHLPGLVSIHCLRVGISDGDAEVVLARLAAVTGALHEAESTMHTPPKGHDEASVWRPGVRVRRKGPCHVLLPDEAVTCPLPAFGTAQERRLRIASCPQLHGQPMFTTKRDASIIQRLRSGTCRAEQPQITIIRSWLTRR
eukprot:scaffold114_cov361-Pinguiococcus_pyrenoidosus.AAC.21